MSIKSVMPVNHLVLCCLLLLFSIFPSIRVLSNDSALCIRWPKYWSFSFSISPFNEYSGPNSFRIDWFDLAVQGTVESLLQHHSSKASILQCSAFFIVQLSHPYMTPGKILPSIFPSLRVFSNESVLHIKWPKYWSFSIRPSNEYSGLISLRMDWMDLLAVQGTLKRLLQHLRRAESRTAIISLADFQSSRHSPESLF